MELKREKKKYIYWGKTLVLNIYLALKKFQLSVKCTPRYLFSHYSQALMMKWYPKTANQSMRRTNIPHRHIANRDLSPDRKASVTKKIHRILLPDNTQLPNSFYYRLAARKSARKMHRCESRFNCFSPDNCLTFVKRENGWLASTLNRQTKERNEVDSRTVR